MHVGCMETTTPNRSRSKLALAILVACTLGAAGGKTYGSTASAPMWPAASSLPRADGKPTVLVFVYADDTHSVDELAGVVGALRNRPFVAVVHVADAMPAATGSLQSAQLLDKGGVEAKRFGVASTGHAVVYDAGGQLSYTGPVAGVRPALGM
jgi:hypothetical protein